ncbi:MAG: signal peptide peptidase SppA [Pseudomonadota bacterium]
MKTFFTALGGAIVGALLGAILLVGLAFGAFSIFAANLNASPDQPDTMVLSLDLRDGLNDQAATTGPEAILGTPFGFVDLLTRLEAAATDDRVKGLFIRISEGGVESSRAEELRSAFQRFKANDKFIIAHSQGMYGGGPSTYRAIAGADEIWFQPGSDMIASGLSFESLFLKGLFDNLSITPEFVALYEFKNAPNTFTEDGYTESHRLAMTKLAESIWETSLSDIAADRGMGVEAVRTALERTPLSADELIEVGFATQKGWPEDAAKAAKERAGEDAGLQSIRAYAPPSISFDAPMIAIVGGQGPIVTGKTGGSLFSEGNAFASDAIAAAILEAGENENVEAIVFRVDSPGGSPTASDQIWRAIERVQSEQEKPVVVSMANVAASGGYYVSTGADWIIANRTTITGSIGIFGGKFAIAEGLERIGVNADSIRVGGPFTGAFTSVETFTDGQRATMSAWLERGYERFLEVVTEGRGMTRDELHAVAKGRVWTGRDALGVGLVDEVGGLYEAIQKAKALAEIEADAEVRLITYPKQPQGFSFGGPMVQASAEELAWIGTVAEVTNDPQIQALIDEIEAAQASRAQARLPAFQER